MNELAKLQLRWSTRRLHQRRLLLNRAPIRMQGKTHSDYLFILVIKTKTTNLSDGIIVDIEKSYAIFSF